MIEKIRHFLLVMTEKYEAYRDKQREKAEKKGKKVRKLSPKIRKILLISMACLLVFIIAAESYWSWQSKHIDADDWLVFETNYIYNARDLSEQLDFTVSLYLNNNIDEEAYLTQMEVIQKEYALFIADREETKEKVKIRPETYSYENKLGIESCERSYDLLGKLINDCVNRQIYSDKEKLGYVYLAYGEELANELAVVQACLSIELK